LPDFHNSLDFPASLILWSRYGSVAGDIDYGMRTRVQKVRSRRPGVCGVLCPLIDRTHRLELAEFMQEKGGNKILIANTIRSSHMQQRLKPAIGRKKKGLYVYTTSRFRRVCKFLLCSAAAEIFSADRRGRIRAKAMIILKWVSRLQDRENNENTVLCCQKQNIHRMRVKPLIFLTLLTHVIHFRRSTAIR